VVVQAAATARLFIQGNLIAVGNAANPIMFTSQADTGPYEWYGIYFDQASGDLRYVTVRYGGITYNTNIYIANGSEVFATHSVFDSASRASYNDDSIYVNNSQVEITESVFSNNGDADSAMDYAFCAQSGSVVTLTNNVFQNIWTTLLTSLTT